MARYSTKHPKNQKQRKLNIKRYKVLTFSERIRWDRSDREDIPIWTTGIKSQSLMVKCFQGRLRRRFGRSAGLRLLLKKKLNKSKIHCFPIFENKNMKSNLTKILLRNNYHSYYESSSISSSSLSKRGGVAIKEKEHSGLFFSLSKRRVSSFFLSEDEFDISR